MELIKNSIQFTLSQLKDCVRQMDENNYTEALDLLSGNTIGKHARHIIELFQCLLLQTETLEVVNYDKRAHSKIIETSVVLSLNSIDEILQKVDNIDIDKPLQLLSCSDVNGSTFLSNSSLSRELQYNIEHAIHHMAIMQMAIKYYFKQIALPKNFGTAYSTIQYQSVE
jgi:hypothetical protein